MRIDDWIHDLPARLELAAEVLDDLANGVWVTSDEDRDRLFTIEAQVWRIAQTTRKTSGEPGTLLPFLDRSLRAVRSNVGLFMRLPVCDETDGIELLEGLVRELDMALSDLELLRLAPDETMDGSGDEPSEEIVDDEEPTWIRRAAGGGR